MEKDRSKREAGITGENLAADFLLKNGYSILARNHRIRIGEIDIIALKEETIHFIEVKHWTSPGYSDPLETFTPKKIKRMRAAAADYLRRDRSLQNYFVSFCLVSVGEKRELNFYLNLF
ncbi:YraN family protein [Leptospira wolffii]|uniref:YraN family protein n=1 Tax=Leptospira wolffii TaxID=409998 RepID=UPI0003065578|nr:YraN family protein [Leptospira wolffii]EPG66871.1 hypothetical protein LEP1GSC061_2022 [Leptospira wolffii serovar Khorat str. Khorat-H2]